MLPTPVNLAIVSAVTLLTLSQASFAAEDHHPHWSYAGSTGPAKWAKLEQDFGACALGKHQSPIDIHDNAAKKADLPAIEFDYKPSPLKIIDNGHTIQVNYASGSSITAGGKKYELLQFHFHKPSEEKINGKPYAMVAHLVHRDSGGQLAVVAVLLKTGAENPFIKTLWANLPKEKETESVVDTVKINVADLLPKDTAYYTFTGSLTTPPCSENVTWFVLKHPETISTDEVARFAKVYPMNARPVQALHGREVRASK
ncbi:MAG TPA: carbonic anhydrase family protein [Burkholderiales bacterium]|nr:carbonic anhydrase family protein [Burkholderiales bacterium]